MVFCFVSLQDSFVSISIQTPDFDQSPDGERDHRKLSSLILIGLFSASPSHFLPAEESLRRSYSPTVYQQENREEAQDESRSRAIKVESQGAFIVPGYGGLTHNKWFLPRVLLDSLQPQTTKRCSHTLTAGRTL
ncbi:hypothetical protein PBY51_024966 [Eleginops maclovinus]|uniref:Uncharacterized protein n=1 Tax=Eleginops maclovinus TaxID=56733 RepID=A0AAN7Y2K3_ELEMC|nr:hypothetical protein PBY51_024966 [Eleginops maclovinus]